MKTVSIGHLTLSVGLSLADAPSWYVSPQPINIQSLGPPPLTQPLAPDAARHLRERLQALQVCRNRDRGSSWADPRTLPHRNYTNPAQQRQMYDQPSQGIEFF